MKRAQELKEWTEKYRTITQRFEAVSELFLEAEEESDFYQELAEELLAIDSAVSELEAKKMLSHEFDPKSCFLMINAGVGGTESCDWVSMLARMYHRWADKNRWKVEIIDKIDGDVAAL